MERARNSRWDREPKLDKSGRPIVARLSEDDFVILELLGQYRYLASDYIAALTGRSLPAIQARLEVLSRKPNCYLTRPHQQRDNASANARRMVYELDKKGIEALWTRGLPCSRKKYLKNFAHELMACQIAASFEIGAAADPAIRILSWRELLASPQMPAATKQLPNAHAIPYLRGSEPAELTGDWRPFVIERSYAAKSYIFVPGFEADCGTEPVDTNDPDRSSIRLKLTGYLACLRQDAPRRHFGATTCMIPFVTTNEQRMRSMMALLERLDPGPLARRFLFKHIPALSSFDKQAPATGHMLSDPWQRAGFEPFRFLEA